MTQSGAKIHRFVSCCSECTCVSWRRWAQSWRSKGLCEHCKPQRRMNFVLEVALVRIEVFLGWAMLVPYSQCRKAIVTEATWSELERLLQEPGWPRQGLGRHVGRLYGKLVGAVRHLANVPPELRFPVLARRNGGFPQQGLLRRVRVEHATVWSAPIGAPRHWVDWRDAFLTRGFDELAPRFQRNPKARGFRGWRQLTRRQLTEDLWAEVTTSTVRLLWHGFHIELLEQTVIFVEASETASDSSPPRSRSSGRRMRRQHPGLEHS